MIQPDVIEFNTELVPASSRVNSFRNTSGAAHAALEETLTELVVETYMPVHQITSVFSQIVNNIMYHADSSVPNFEGCKYGTAH